MWINLSSWKMLIDLRYIIVAEFLWRSFIHNKNISLFPLLRNSHNIFPPDIRTLWIAMILYKLGSSVFCQFTAKCQLQWVWKIREQFILSYLVYYEKQKTNYFSIPFTQIKRYCISDYNNSGYRFLFISNVFIWNSIIWIKNPLMLFSDNNI